MKTSKKRIFIVDDHPLIREGTASIINQEPDLVLCGAAATAAEALKEIPKAKPDVVIVDLSLEGRSGLELIKTLRAQMPKLYVVVYTMHEEGIYSQRAMADGASYYVTKSQPPSRLLSVLREAANCEKAVRDNGMARHEMARLPLGQLTNRELEIFELRGQGLTGDHIAAHLHLSRKTVDSHLENIKHKLHLTSSAELLRMAVMWIRSKNTL